MVKMRFVRQCQSRIMHKLDSSGLGRPKLCILRPFAFGDAKTSTNIVLFCILVLVGAKGDAGSVVGVKGLANVVVVLAAGPLRYVLLVCPVLFLG